MKIQEIFLNPEQFEITKLSGGYLGGAEKVSVLDSEEQYVLKPMGNTSEQVGYSITLLKHIKGLGQNFKHMAKVCDWDISETGTLFALFEFIENTENGLANIAEMLQISNWAFLASKQYDYTKVSQEVDLQKTVLHEIKHNGVERYTEKYFLPYVNDNTQIVIDWMVRWANYFISDDEFREQYLECVGFIHRDIHRHNIVINNGKPYLIDFDFSGVDCRLIEITRPTNVYIEIDDFLPMYTKAKEINEPYFSETEEKIIDRILVLDIMANLGWEANEIYNADEGEYKREIVNFLQNRLSYLYLLMINRSKFSLDFV